MESIAPNRIKEMRTRRGMSLSELSELTGMTRSELHKLEKGVRRIRTDHLPPLSRSLECSPEELLNPELAEQIIGDRIRYLGTADGKDGPTPTADLPVFGRTESDGRFVLDEMEPQAFVQRNPYLYNVKTAYSVYMPDNSMEPRVAQGALLYINPILPARPGDLALARWSNGTARVVRLEHSKGDGLVGVTEDGKTRLVFANEKNLKIERVIGISFII